MKPTPSILSDTVTFILAGGRGERLAPLTRRRSKPAVPFGDGRIIDFVLKNCLDSGLKKPFVITQYQSAHLERQVRRWWRDASANGADVMAAPVCLPAPLPEYAGTADALFRNLSAVDDGAKHVMVLSADHIYEMDYREMLELHKKRSADATLGAIVYPSESSRQFGILEVDRADRIYGFEEKPKHPRELPGQPGKVLANMGVYVFRREILMEALRRDVEDAGSAHDIGRNILPQLVAASDVRAFRFEDRATGESKYWRDVGTIDSYYETVMDWHRRQGLQPTTAPNVHVHPSAEVIDSILFPGVRIGAGASVRRAILDENVEVRPGGQVGCGTDGSRFHRSSNGITVVGAGTIVFATGSQKPLMAPPLAVTAGAFSRA